MAEIITTFHYENSKKKKMLVFRGSAFERFILICNTRKNFDLNFVINFIRVDLIQIKK